MENGSTLSATFSEQDTAEVRNRPPPAEEGKADALYNLALLSLGDKASEADVPKALVLLEKAAEQGLAAAWNLQAWLLIRGVGSPADRDRAIVLYRRAADAGDANAMYNWAVLNLETQPSAALGYLKKAVEQKHIGAMALLGESLLRGRLVAQQSALAANLLTAAAPHSRRAAWVLGAAASAKQVLAIPIAKASMLLGMALQEQTRELGGKTDDGPPWPVASEPSAWAKLERLLSRIGNEHNHLRRRAAAAVAAHELLAQLGPAASRELLADALSEGQIGFINDGARQVARALQLGSLKPTFPKVANSDVEATARGTRRGSSTAGAAKAAAPAPSNDSDASLVANFNKLWSGGDRHEQWQAVRLLLEMDAQSAAPLLDLAATSQDPHVRSELMFVLSTWRVPKFGDFIRAGLSDSDARVREFAVRAAAANRIELTEAETTRLLADASVRNIVMRGSGDTGWSIPDEALINAIRSPNEVLRESAVYAARSQPRHAVRLALIGMLNSPDLPSPLIALQKIGLEKEGLLVIKRMTDEQLDEDSLDTYRNCSVVETVKLDSIAIELAAMMVNPRPLIRKQALWAVGCIGAPSFLDLIERLALDDPEPSVRRMGVIALNHIVEPRSEAVLVKATNDSVPEIRYLALDAMTDVIAQHEAAIKLSPDTDPRVRAHVVAVLQKYDSQQARDALAKLRNDSSELVRERFIAINLGIASIERRRISTLSLSARTEELCRVRLRDADYALRELIAIGIDQTLDEKLRARALFCGQSIARTGMSEELVEKLYAALTDPTNKQMVSYYLVRLLEESALPRAAKVVAAYEMSELGGCPPGSSRMASFPPLARAEAIKPFLQHPNRLVEQYAAICLGAEREVTEMAFDTLGDEQGARAMLDVIARPHSPEAATALLGLLAHSGSATDQTTFLLHQALWMTLSQAAYDDAMAYKGPLRVDGDSNFINAWAGALAFKPSVTTLDRLMTELPRAIGNHALILAAIEMSAAVPDAKLDIAVVANLADVIYKRFNTWQILESGNTFSPLAFLATCIALRDDPANVRELNYGARSTTQVSPAQHAALRRVTAQCVDHWHRKGGSPPAVVMGWAIRLFLSAGLVDEAIGISTGQDTSIYSNAAFEVSRAEALMQAGHQVQAVQLLDHLDSRWLPLLGKIDGRRYLHSRSLLVRGLLALKANEHMTARRALRAAADRGGDSTTGIVAFGLALRYGVGNAVPRARLLADEFNLLRASGPLAIAAMQEILSFLVLHDAQQGELQQSLINADRLVVLQSYRYRPLPPLLADREKAFALLQLQELETRVVMLEKAALRAHENLTKDDNSEPAELVNARQDLKTWLTDMRIRYPASVDLLKPVPVDLLKLRQALGPDRALIQYILLPQHSFAWVVTDAGVTIVPIPYTERDIRFLVAQAREMLRDATSVESDSTQEAEALLKLSAALVEPVRKTAGDRSHWIVVPHASLHALPFAALNYGNSTRRLIAHHTLSLVGSASAVKPLRNLPDATRKFLIVGNPAPQGANMTGLSQAETEANRIGKIYSGDAKVFVGPAATRQLLVGKSLEKTAVHLAVHGEVLPGDQSRLTFADGYLTLHDIWALSLIQSPRVVLAACESGLGRTLTGNEVLSLANGFLFAGVSDVVSSLWKVPDPETMQFMESFYLHLADGMNTVDALAQTQRDSIARGHPAQVWAAFTVYGQ